MTMDKLIYLHPTHPFLTGLGMVLILGLITFGLLQMNDYERRLRLAKVSLSEEFNKMQLSNCFNWTSQHGITLLIEIWLEAGEIKQVVGSNRYRFVNWRQTQCYSIWDSFRPFFRVSLWQSYVWRLLSSFLRIIFRGRKTNHPQLSNGAGIQSSQLLTSPHLSQIAAK